MGAQLRTLATASARVLQIVRPKVEGAGKTGCALHPRSHVQKADSKNAHEHTGSAEAIRPSLRNGFTTYFALTPARPSLFVTVAPKKRELPRNLTPAIGASGPHDFVVRSSCARQSQLSRPPLPAPTFVTMANAPLTGRDGSQYAGDLGQESRQFRKIRNVVEMGRDKQGKSERGRQIRFCPHQVLGVLHPFAIQHCHRNSGFCLQFLYQLRHLFCGR